MHARASGFWSIKASRGLPEWGKILSVKLTTVFAPQRDYMATIIILSDLGETQRFARLHLHDEYCVAVF